MLVASGGMSWGGSFSVSKEGGRGGVRREEGRGGVRW